MMVRIRRLLALGAVLVGPALTGCSHYVVGQAAPPPIDAYDTVQRPEDMVAIPDSQWLVVSEMCRDNGSLSPGALTLLNHETGTLQPARVRIGEPPDDGWCDGCETAREIRPSMQPDGHGIDGFCPHGIDLAEYRGRQRLLVVSHPNSRLGNCDPADPKGESADRIEVMEILPSVGGQAPEILWRGCISAPEGLSINDVAAVPKEAGFVVSNSLRKDTIPLLAGSACSAPFPTDTGDVRAWRATHWGCAEASGNGDSWCAIPNTRSSFPNGVAISPRDGALFIAPYCEQRVHRIARGGATRSSIGGLGILPDNFSWTEDGWLLTTGPSIAPMYLTPCLAREPSLRGEYCDAPYEVLAINPNSRPLGRPSPRYTSDGRSGYGNASVAVELAGDLFIGSPFANRLVRVPSASLTPLPAPKPAPDAGETR